MKVVVVLLIFTFWGAVLAEDEEDKNNEKSKESEGHDHATSFPPNSSALYESCPYKCGRQANANAPQADKTLLASMKPSTDICGRYDPANLKALCDINKNQVDCYSTCKQDVFKAMYLDFADYNPCPEYDSFKENHDCISKTCSEVHNDCESKCPKPAPEVWSRSLSMSGWGLYPDKEQAKKDFEENCKFRACYKDCAEPKFTNECNKEAAAYLVNLLVNPVKTIKVVLDKTGGDDLLPQECLDLLK